MVTYELIQKLEQLPYYRELLTGGIIPMSVIDHKVIYEFYLRELVKLRSSKYQKNIKTQAKYNTAVEFDISERSVYMIVRKMKS